MAACSAGAPERGEETRSTASAIDPSQVSPAGGTQYVVTLNGVSINWAVDGTGTTGSYVEYEGLGIKVGNNEVDTVGCSLGAVGTNSYLGNCVSGAGLEGAPLSRNITVMSPTDPVVLSMAFDHIEGVTGPVTNALAGELGFAGSVTQLAGAVIAWIPTPYTAAIGTSLGIVGNELAVTGNIIGAHPTGPRSCAGGLVANPTATSGTPLDELTQTYTGQQLHDLTVAGPFEAQYKIVTDWNGGCISSELVNLTIDRLWSGTGPAAFAKSPDGSVVQGLNGVEEFSVNPGYGGIQHDSFSPVTQSWSSEIISQNRNDNSSELILGSTPTMPITAVSRLPGMLDVFYADDVWNMWWSSQPSPGAGWWTSSLGVAGPHQQFTAVARTGLDLDLFWVDGGAIYWATWDTYVLQPGTPPVPLQLVPSFARITPYNTVPSNATLAAVSRTPNTIDLFYVGSDGGIWNGSWNWPAQPNYGPADGYGYYGTTVGGWSGYEQQATTSLWTFGELPYSAGKTIAGCVLTATARTDDNIDVFFIGNDGGLWTSNWYTGAPAYVTAEIAGTAGLGRAGEPISAVSRQPNDIDVVYANNYALEVTSWFDTSNITLASAWTTSRVETGVNVAWQSPVTLSAPSSWSLALGFYDIVGAEWTQSWTYPAPSYAAPAKLPSPPAPFQVSPANPSIAQHDNLDLTMTVLGNWATASDLTVSVTGLPSGVTATVGAATATSTGLTVPVVLSASPNATIVASTYITVTGKTSAGGVGQNGPLTQVLTVPFSVSGCTAVDTACACGAGYVDVCGRTVSCGVCSVGQVCSSSHCCPTGETFDTSTGRCTAPPGTTNQCICSEDHGRWETNPPPAHCVIE